MNNNFSLLYERILDANKLSDIKEIRKILKQIKKNVLCVGVGGSKVVSEYASMIFNQKNKCFTNNMEPRDSLYYDKTNVNNIFVCSFSGSNFGVEVALNNNKKRYLLSNCSSSKFGGNLIQYKSSIKREKSFISLAATLIPTSILLNYYLNGKRFESIVKEIFSNVDNFDFIDMPVYEIMSGLDTIVASTYLESTLVEAGLSDFVIHHKYDYCHGRTTLAFHRDSSLIYLCTKFTQLDKVLLKEAESLYKEIIILQSNYNDMVINNFNLTVKAMFLTKYLAELKGKDLSEVEYAPAVKVLYHYEGEM